MPLPVVSFSVRLVPGALDGRGEHDGLPIGVDADRLVAAAAEAAGVVELVRDGVLQRATAEKNGAGGIGSLRAERTRDAGVFRNPGIEDAGVDRGVAGVGVGRLSVTVPMPTLVNPPLPLIMPA